MNKNSALLSSLRGSLSEGEAAIYEVSNGMNGCKAISKTYSASAEKLNTVYLL